MASRGSRKSFSSSFLGPANAGPFSDIRLAELRLGTKQQVGEAPRGEAVRGLGTVLREAVAYPAAITSSNNASTSAWPIVSLTLTRVVLPCSGRMALMARSCA
jgi:hypothetical protein